jgi:hypothetical protein
VTSIYVSMGLTSPQYLPRADTAPALAQTVKPAPESPSRAA